MRDRLCSDVWTRERIENISDQELNELAKTVQVEIKQLKAEGKGIVEENYTENMWYIIEVFRPEIERLSAKHSPYFNPTREIDGQTAYERRLRKKVLIAAEYYVERGNFRTLVRYAFRQATGEFYNRRSSYAKNTVSLDWLTTETDSKVNRKPITYITDPRQDVEKTVIGREIRNCLYKKFGHCDRRRFVLDCFDDNLTKQREIAKEMSDKFGGNYSSYERFIRRFKNEMKKYILNRFEDRFIS